MVKKRFLLVAFIIIAVILVSSITYMNIGIQANLKTILIRNIAVSNKTIQILGTTASSGEAYAGYSYIIRNNNLYLELRYCIVNPIHHTGDFNILIEDNAIKIKNIYLQGGKTGDKKLVWTN